MFTDKSQFVCVGFWIDQHVLGVLACVWGGGCMQQRARNANQFLTAPYLGHLGLHPGGFQRRHSLLCCSWTVEIHKAIAWRERARRRKEKK